MLAMCVAGTAASGAADSPSVPDWRLEARVVAVGLPGIAGVRQIGRFHFGGPIPGNPEFLLQTDPGRVLDPQRLMVAVASNFGAMADAGGGAPGSVLSIDPRGDKTLVIGPRFASHGGQATTDAGRVQVFAAQGSGFSNARHNASAKTMAMTSVAGPRYVSVNNAFGRPWVGNAPAGVQGAGSVTVVDPDGAPLANAPSDDAGGVFAGTATNRHRVTKGYASTLLAKAFNYRDSAQLTPGALDRGVLGTAFLGASPDGSGLAVFATVTADGALEQVHVQDGVDGLAPSGTVLRSDDDEAVIGMAFKWNPQRVLYVADAGRNGVAVLHLADDRRQFRVTRAEHIDSPMLKEPVDLAAALPEIANPAFASHTTLAGGSDLYVANRGDGSIVRMPADRLPVPDTLPAQDRRDLRDDRARTARSGVRPPDSLPHPARGTASPAATERRSGARRGSHRHRLTAHRRKRRPATRDPRPATRDPRPATGDRRPATGDRHIRQSATANAASAAFLDDPRSAPRLVSADRRSTASAGAMIGSSRRMCSLVDCYDRN